MQGSFLDKGQDLNRSYPLDKMVGSRRAFRAEIDFSQEGRIPPNAFDREQDVLSCILIDPDAIERVLEVFGENGETVFYDYKHRIIFKAMLTLYNRRDAIDIITVSEELKRNEELDKVGGNVFLAELSNKVASAANVEHYAYFIKEKSLYRRLISIATQISSKSYQQNTDVFDLIEAASQEIFQISQAGIKKKATDIKTLLKDATRMIESLRSRKSAITGVASGFSELDKLTAGFQPSDMIIIAARPSTGKTAFSLALARNAAVESKAPVLFFSLEMSEIQLATRLLCAEAYVESQLVRTGKISSTDMTNIVSRMDKLSQAEIYIDDTPAISIIELAAKARRLRQEKKIGMVVVDYLQLISAVKDGRNNREQEIAQISRSLKSIAKELQIPVIALAQLNRAMEQRSGDKRPQLSDLRESGSIEQDADVVMFLSSPERYGLQTFQDGSSTKDIIEVIIGKQRNGPIGDVKLKFLKQYGRFESVSKIYSDEDFQSPVHDNTQKAAEEIEAQNRKEPPSAFIIDSEDTPF